MGIAVENCIVGMLIACLLEALLLRVVPSFIVYSQLCSDKFADICEVVISEVELL